METVKQLKRLTFIVFATLYHKLLTFVVELEGRGFCCASGLIATVPSSSTLIHFASAIENVKREKDMNAKSRLS